MVFKSQAEFEKYVLDRCKIAVAQTEQKVYEIIEDFLNKFYAEYPDTKEYIRTRQFFNSLVKTNVKSVGKGFEAEVYFDLGKINYLNPAQGKSGKWHDVTKTDERILRNNLEGAYPHGWYQPAGGTGVWTNAYPVIDAQAIDYLKKSLIANGIPITK